jgi:hypothetical protein
MVAITGGQDAVNNDRLMPLVGDQLQSHGPLGECLDVVGPHKRSFWLRRAEDLMFCASNECQIVPGVGVMRLHGIVAEELWGSWVLDMRPGDAPVKVWLAGGRVWE